MLQIADYNLHLSHTGGRRFSTCQLGTDGDHLGQHPIVSRQIQCQVTHSP